MNTQAMPCPATVAEAARLLAAGRLLNLAGLPLVLHPCDWCGGDSVGETCPLSLTCPVCGAVPRQRCRRPSGHVLSDAFGGLHPARDAAAETADVGRYAAGDPSVPLPWRPAQMPQEAPLW